MGEEGTLFAYFECGILWRKHDGQAPEKSTVYDE